MTPCPRCGREILRATTLDGTRVTLDADQIPEGTYGVWRVREGVRWIQRARPIDPGWRDLAYTQHDCVGATGEQLSLSTEAATPRLTTANSQES